MPPLSDAIVAFVDRGLSVFAASRDGSLQPWIARAGAVSLSEDRCSVTVYVPDRAGASLLAVLGPGAPLAVTLTEVPTHRSLQLKGTVTGLRPARPDERPHVESQAHGFEDDLGVHGLPLAVVRRLAVWPATAVEMRIESSFEQTPGPGAGGPA